MSACHTTDRFVCGGPGPLLTAYEMDQDRVAEVEERAHWTCKSVNWTLGHVGVFFTVTTSIQAFVTVTKRQL